MKLFFALLFSMAMLVACGGDSGSSGGSSDGSEGYTSKRTTGKFAGKGTEGSGSTEADAGSSDAGSTGGGEVADVSSYTGAISGTVKFEGAAPKARPVRMDAACGAFHTERVFSNEVVVNDNGTLKNVFVYIKDGLGGKTFNVPSDPVVFDQQGCRYEPHVFGVMAGQDIKILNSDPMLHNIHAFPTINRPFNFGMPKQGSEMTRSFRKSEVMVKIKCDVHPWMGAYAGVVDHPYYGVSSDDGSFSMSNVPPGTYTVEAWHEKYGTTTSEVTIGDGESINLEFSFSE